MSSSAQVPECIFTLAHKSFPLTTPFSQNASITQIEALEDTLKLNNVVPLCFHLASISCGFTPTSKLERDRTQGENKPAVPLHSHCFGERKMWVGWRAVQKMHS